MKKFLLVIASTIAAAVSMNAAAATTGTVNFQGSVVNATCEIKSGTENQTIVMPQVISSDFTGVNQPRGQIVPFQIILTGCDASVPGNVDIAFDFATTSGLDDVIDNSVTTTGVGVRILDSQNKAIAMTPGNFFTSPEALATGEVVFDLRAQYVSTAFPVNAGLVNATATIEVGYP